MFFNHLSIVNISIYVVCLVLITPFIVVFSSYSPYEYPKFLFYGIGAGILLCIALFSWLYQKTSVRFFHNHFYLLVIAYICVVFLANFLGADFVASFWGSPFRHQGFLLLLVNVGLFFAISLQNKKDRELAYIVFEKGAVVVAFLLCVFAFWQAFAAFVLHAASIPLYQGRIVGTFGNPNSFGGYLVMLLPFVLLFRHPFGVSFRRIKFVFRFIFVLGIVFAILLTGSRGALLATVILFALVGLLNKGFIIKGWRKILLGLAFFILLFLGGLLQSRQSPWDNRYIIWQGGWEAFLERPVLGYGQENFAHAFTKVKFYPLDNAHNIFLEVAVASGIVGLVLFLSILGKAFFQANLAIKMSLVAFIIVAQFNPLSIGQIAFFWLLLGFKDL